MSHRHYDKISQKGGKFPTVILTSFHKKEEKVPRSFLQSFTKRRKMSPGYSDKFSKMEENFHRLFLQVFNNGRKMSLGHSHKFSQEGGKCPVVILRKFHKKE